MLFDSLPDTASNPIAPTDAERPAGGLAIREDRRRGLFVEGLSEWEVRSPADIAELAPRGGV